MFKNDGMLVQEYEYDFAVDGGAQGTIDLSAKANKDPLPAGAIPVECYAEVVTAVTSAGALTLSWGNGSANDVDGYSGVAKAVGALLLDTVFDGKADSGALLGVTKLAAGEGPVSVTIGAADATAGKVKFRVVYVY